MADASYLQTSFLGGEWSPLAQGMMADPNYRSGMNVARNVLPLEEGSAARRPGTRLVGPTRKGVPGVLRAFDFQQNHPYNLELTAGHMRFLAGSSMIVESFGLNIVVALNTANPVQVTTATAHGWSTGDEVLFQWINTSPATPSIAALLGRQVEITVTSTTTFTCADAVTGLGLDGTSMVLGSADITVARIVDFVTPYAQADLQAINQVQDQSDLLLLHNKYPPQAILSTAAPTAAANAVFTISAAVFKDGPYLDPPKDGTTITPGAVNGSTTLTLAGGSTRWAATDVGRMVRLFSEPAAWAIGTAYTTGQQVKFNGAYYQALANNTGKEPDQDVVNWGVSTTAAIWNWALITAFSSATVVTATLSHVIDVTGLEGPDLPRTTACATWRMGLQSATSGYASAGTYHEGRLWLTGILGNRIDGSVSNDFFNFAPTDAFGTVADANSCAYIFNAKDVNQIFWMQPDALGIVCGTQAGEWLVQASASNDNLTPTSVQAHRRTDYGCANVPAKRTGITISFVQRYQKKLLEYITTDFRGLSAHNIALKGKHLTQKGIVEIAYQSEKVPTIWARLADGSLISCTYKRESPYASDPANFAAWARHDLGGGFKVESLQSGPNFDGTLDAVSMIVSDGTSRWNMTVTDLFDVDWQIGDSLFVDFAETPAMYQIITGSPKVLRLYGLQYLAGKSVDIFAAGIDCGTLSVAADGHVDIPIDTATIPLLTSAWLTGLNSPSNFHSLGLALVNVAPGVANLPTLTGIQNLDATAIGPTNLASQFSTVDWDGKRFFMYDGVNGKLQIDGTTSLAQQGALLSWANATAGITYGEDGFLYGVTGATNCGILNRFNLTTLAQDASFGVASSGFTTTSGRWALARDMDVITDGFSNSFMVSTSAINTVNEIAVLNLSIPGAAPISWTGFSLTMDENRGVVTRGSKLSSFARAHVLALSGSNGAHGVQLGLYSIYAQGLVAFGHKNATFAASAFGNNFTHASSLTGIILDETDSNIIAHVSQVQLQGWSGASTYNLGDLVKTGTPSHDYISLSGGNTNHTPIVGGTAFWQDLGVTSPNNGDSVIAKINSRTGVVMWSLPIGADIASSGAQLNATRVRSGKYLFYDNASGTTVIHQIDTIAGTDTQSAPIVGTAATYQFYNDFNGELIFFSSYTSGAGAPTPIGSTPTSWTKNWATLGPAAGPAVPAALPPSVGINYMVPVAIGYAYPSQGQVLRPIAPQESGAQNGPALGKTRRGHMFSALCFASQGVSFGTTFDHLRPAQFRDTNDETVLPLTLLYSNVHWDTLDDTYSFDSMLCWQVTRPYPATICTIGAFLHTQDR